MTASASSGRSWWSPRSCCCSPAAIWLGGHPEYLPGFARTALVDDDQGRLFEEAVDQIADNYYEPVDRDKLLDAGLDAGVKSLDDRFSTYFDPKQYQSFQEATEGAFEGVGMSVNEVARGLRVLTVYDGSPAQRGGIKQGRPDRLRRRQVARGPDLAGGHDADQGPGGHRGHARRRQRRQAGARRHARARAGRRPRRGGRDAPSSATARSPTCGSPASPPAPTGRCARRSTSCSTRAPRASCSTCATTAAACSTRRC